MRKDIFGILAFVGCMIVIALAISKTDALSCLRQNAPRAAEQKFLRAAAAVSEGRQQGDTQLANVVKSTAVRNSLLKLAKDEGGYHNTALRVAKSVPQLSCYGPFPTAH